MKKTKPKALIALAVAAALVGLFLYSSKSQNETGANAPEALQRAKQAAGKNFDFGKEDGTEASARATGSNAPNVDPLQNDPKFTRDETESLNAMLAHAAGRTPSKEELETAEKTTLYIKFQNKINPILEGKKLPVSRTDYAELSKETDRLYKDKYLLIAEYVGVKTRLLESQYTGKELEAKQLDLKKEVMDRHNALVAAADPAKDPRKQAFKAKEKAILAEANTMKTFPDNMTKEQYILDKVGQLTY
ncbi:MAG: hypothetical protein Q7U28_12260 [Aquabacterium sp.]|nr:hypothetical protein [Aquabacterium sp.]